MTRKKERMNYSTFNGAYAEENLQKVARVSYDIPTDIQKWREIVAKTPVLVIYMWSEKCRPCHLIRDKFEKLGHMFQDENVLFFKDNIDLPTSFHKNQVDVVPTFFLLCDGRELRHPTHKSVYNGWSDDLKDSIRFHISQSEKLHIPKAPASTESSPQLYCHNNVCYLKKPE